MALVGSFRNFAQMVKSIATLGVNNSIVKLFVENKENKKELSVIYSTFFWMFLIVSAVLAGLVLIFASPISNFLFYSENYSNPIRLFGLFLPFMVINVFWLAIYNGLEKYKSIVAIQIISSVFVFAATALMIWKHQIQGGLLSITIGECLMVIVTFLFVRKDKEYFKFNLHKIMDKKYVEIIKKFSIMAFLSAVIVPLTLLFIRNSVVKCYSVQEAGIWDAVNRLSGFYMMFFSSGLSLYYMPKFCLLYTSPSPRDRG